MRDLKSKKHIYGLLLVLFVLAAGIQATAAKALNEAFAVSAQSILLDRRQCQLHQRQLH